MSCLVILVNAGSDAQSLQAALDAAEAAIAPLRA
jgi:hypothetical protein